MAKQNPPQPETEPTEEVVAAPETPAQPSATDVKLQELAQLLTRVKHMKDLANLDLTGWDPATRTGMETAKQNAKDSLQALLAKYRAEIYENSAVVFVAGSPGQTEALEEAATKMGAVVVEAGRIYRMIAEVIEAKLGPERRLLTDFILDIERQANEACNAFGVNGSFLRVDTRHYDKPVKDFQALVDIVRETFRTSAPEYIKPLGETVAILSARQEMYGFCERTGLAEIPIAVVVTQLTPDEVAGFQTYFLPGRPFTTLNADSVKNADKALAKAAQDLLKKLGIE